MRMTTKPYKRINGTGMIYLHFFDPIGNMGSQPPHPGPKQPGPDPQTENVSTGLGSVPLKLYHHAT